METLILICMFNLVFAAPADGRERSIVNYLPRVFRAALGH